MTDPTRTSPPEDLTASVGTFAVDITRPLDHAVAVPTNLTVPGYELLGEIGRGGMGVVFRARQVGLNRDVALKMLLATDDAGRGLVRFLAEAEAVAAVRHPHVVQVYEYGDHEGRPFLALEFLSGGTLADLLRAGKLAPAMAARLLTQIARGVAAAHDLGIVHRDLKPSNVLFDAAGEPKVADFGLAKRGTGSDLTQTKATLGTPAYMAPETAQGAAKFAGPTTDVWALGVILYEMLTGIRPFEAEDAWGMMRKVIETSPTPPSRTGEVPRDLELICLKCLAKEPHHRYATAGALANDLDRFLAGRPTTARPIPVYQQTWRWARRNPAVAGFATTAILALVLGAVAASLFGLAALRQADRAALAADAARNEANRADLATADALRETARAASERDQARLALYASRARLLQLSWQDGRTDRVLDLLARQRPPADSPDLRGFEWGYIDRATRGELFRIDTNANFAHLTRTGTILVVGQNGIAEYLTPAGPATPLVEQRFSLGATISPDEQLIAAVTSERDAPFSQGTIRLFDRLGRPVAVCRGAFQFHSLAFTADHRHLIGATASGKAVSWDTTTGQRVAEVKFQHAFVWSVATHPTASRVVAAGYDGTVVVWDPATGAELVRLEGDTGGVFRVAWGGDGRRILGLTSDKQVIVWDAETGHVIARRAAEVDSLGGIAISPDGRQYAAVTRNHVVRIWDLESGAERLAIPGHEEIPQDIRFSPDGRRLITNSRNNIVRIWDVTGRTDIVDLDGNAGRLRIWSMTWSNDGTRLATGGADGTARLWDPTTGRELIRLAHFAHQVRGIALTPDGKQFVAGTLDRSLTLYDTATGQMIRTFVGATRGIVDLAIAPDGQTLITVGYDILRDSREFPAELIVWNIATGEIVHREQTEALPIGSDGIPDRFTTIAIHPSGSEIAVGSSDGVVHRWSLSPFAPHEPIKIEPIKIDRWVQRVKFSPDGKMFAAVSGKGVDLFDAASGIRFATLTGHAANVTSIAFSPDSRRVATGSDDRTVRLWDPLTGEELLTIADSEEQIREVAFSPDGNRLAVGGEVRVRVYEAVVPSAAILEDREVYREVANRFAELVDRSAVLASIASATFRPEFRASSSRLADTFLVPDPRHFRSPILEAVLTPAISPTAVGLAVRRAEAYAAAYPASAVTPLLLGATQYRSGRFDQAVATLAKQPVAKTNEDRGLMPFALAFRALATAAAGTADAAEHLKTLDDHLATNRQDRGLLLQLRAEAAAQLENRRERAPAPRRL